MEDILHQLIGGLSHYLQGFIHPVQDFFHQQYVAMPLCPLQKKTNFSRKAGALHRVTPQIVEKGVWANSAAHRSRVIGAHPTISRMVVTV